MWVVSGMSAAAAADQNGAQTGLLYSGKYVCGLGKLMPLRPFSAAHSTSAIDASMSQTGKYASPTWRSGETDTKSASHRLYIRTPTCASSGSSGLGIRRMSKSFGSLPGKRNGKKWPFWLPWKMTSPATPSKSMSRRRACGSQWPSVARLRSQRRFTFDLLMGEYLP